MRIPTSSIVLGALGAALLLPAAQPARGQFTDLLPRVPGAANALVLVDVDGVYRSQMAVAKGWKERIATKWGEVPIMLPPEAKRFVLASHLDPLNNLRSAWEVAVIDLAEPLSLNSIARAEGGYIDSIGQTSVVWTPSRAYFVQLDKQLLGLVYPDDRQAVARWIDLSRTGRLAPLSGYLKEASGRLRSEGQIVLAIDLSDVAQPHRIDAALKEMRILEGKKVNPRAVADALSSLKGVTLTIRLESQALAEARVDFKQDVKILKPFAKELVFKMMDRVGASVVDPDAWKVTVEDNSILFRGTLSEAGLSRISGLLELPASKLASPKKEKEAAAASKSDLVSEVGETSRRYFHSLTKLIVELRDEVKKSQNPTLWMEKTARKIDQLPLLNVDDELLAFAAKVSTDLRQMAEGRRDVGRMNAVAQSQAYGVGWYGNGGYAGGYTTGGAVRAQIGQQASVSSSSIQTKGMQGINNGLADMRRRLTKKYQIEF